jgi:hypothetical protein
MKNQLPAASLVEAIIALTLIATAITLGTTIYVNTFQADRSLVEIAEEGAVKTRILSSFFDENEKMDELIEDSDSQTTQLRFEENLNEEIITLHRAKGSLIWSITRYKSQNNAD